MPVEAEDMHGKKIIEAALALSLTISGCAFQKNEKKAEESKIKNNSSENNVDDQNDNSNLEIEENSKNNEVNNNVNDGDNREKNDSVEKNAIQKEPSNSTNIEDSMEIKEDSQSAIVMDDGQQDNTIISNYTGSGYSEERVEPNPGISLTSFRIPIQQSVQENGYFCVPACLQMVLRVHGIEVSQNLLAQEMNTSSVTGTEYVDLQRIVNKYCFGSENINDNQPGYHIQTIAIGDNSNATMSTLENRIRADMASNDPVFIAIDRAYLYPNLSHGNHMIILIGYSTFTGTNTIANYYIIDPSYVVQDPVYGGLKIVTPEELLNAIAYNEEPAYIW